LEPVIASLAAKLNPGGVLAFTYEPLLPDHATQNRPETTYRVEDSPRLKYTMYREVPGRVLDWIARAGLLVLEHRALPNEYERDDGPVELRFVAALRPE
ncbi:MAG: hypothetical protein JOY69_03435, partial [Candidatus Eremiobacteraeota bacterium]|nr:hypothetical protein [Candidatus Eremiobacteraeota bacterium]